MADVLDKHDALASPTRKQKRCDVGCEERLVNQDEVCIVDEPA
jgi:hypothetical protein